MTGDAAATFDVLLLASDWRTRVLLRAQLIEAGLTVHATDTWPGARRAILSAGPSGIVIVDLRDLDTPGAVLRELAALVPPARVIIIGALATAAPEALRQVARAILRRPVAIGDVVVTALRLMKDARQT